MLGGLGTPTHTKVVDFLNASRVPDLFVSSGCLCWDEPKDHPQTFGWQPDYTVEGKILGQWIAQKYKGKKVAYFLQNDDFGADGAKGLDKYIPKAAGRHPPDLRAGQHRHRAADGQDQGVGRRGHRHVHDPRLHGARRAGRVEARLPPTAGRQQRRLGSTTLKGLLKAFSKGKAPSALIDGIQSDAYLPPSGNASNDWIAAVHARSTASTSPSSRSTATWSTGWRLAYTFVEALQRAGANPTRQSIVQTIETQKLTGPGARPLPLQQGLARRLHRRPDRRDQERRGDGDGQADGHRRRRRRHHRVHDEPDERPGQRDTAELVGSGRDRRRQSNAAGAAGSAASATSRRTCSAVLRVRDSSGSAAASNQPASSASGPGTGSAPGSSGSHAR